MDTLVHDSPEQDSGDAQQTPCEQDDGDDGDDEMIIDEDEENSEDPTQASAAEIARVPQMLHDVYVAVRSDVESVIGTTSEFPSEEVFFMFRRVFIELLHGAHVPDCYDELDPNVKWRNRLEAFARNRFLAVLSNYDQDAVFTNALRLAFEHATKYDEDDMFIPASVLVTEKPFKADDATTPGDSVTPALIAPGDTIQMFSVFAGEDRRNFMWLSAPYDPVVRLHVKKLAVCVNPVNFIGVHVAKFKKDNVGMTVELMQRKALTEWDGIEFVGQVFAYFAMLLFGK